MHELPGTGIQCAELSYNYCLPQWPCLNALISLEGSGQIIMTGEQLQSFLGNVSKDGSDDSQGWLTNTFSDRHKILLGFCDTKKKHWVQQMGFALPWVLCFTLAYGIHCSAHIHFWVAKKLIRRYFSGSVLSVHTV